MEAARPATLADLPVIAELANAAADELRVQRGGHVLLARESRPQPPLDTLTASLDDADQRVVVGTVHDAIVGYGVVHLEKLHTGELLAVVDDIYTDPMARGIGVGEAVMDLLVAFATEHGAVGIDSIVLPGMRDSKNFFETFGLVARAIVVHRALRPDATDEEAEPE